MSVDEAKEECDKDPECDGFTYCPQDKCFWKVSGLEPTQFRRRGNKFDVYVKVKGPDKAEKEQKARAGSFLAQVAAEAKAKSEASAARTSLSSLLVDPAAAAGRSGLRLLGVRAPEGLPWQYPFYDSERQSFVGYLPSAFDQQQMKKMWDELVDHMEDLGWQNIMMTHGKQFKITGRQKWFVAPGCRCQYLSKGDKVKGYAPTSLRPVTFPPWMMELMQAVMPLCGLDDPKTWPNCCYLSCHDAKGGTLWQAVDQSMFHGTTSQISSIISLTVGGKRFFEFRRKGVTTDSDITCKHELSGGDICTMEGMTQAHYEHRMAPCPKGGMKMSLVWQWIVAHEKGCRQ